jgi:hypothetical protein
MNVPSFYPKTSVVYLDSLNPDPDKDPDPAFQVNPDPDREPVPDQDTDPGFDY